MVYISAWHLVCPGEYARSRRFAMIPSKNAPGFVQPAPAASCMLFVTGESSTSGLFEKCLLANLSKNCRRADKGRSTNGLPDSSDKKSNTSRCAGYCAASCLIRASRPDESAGATGQNPPHLLQKSLFRHRARIVWRRSEEHSLQALENIGLEIFRLLIVARPFRRPETRYI